MAEENKPQHQWTDKQKVNALTKLIIEHNDELPQEFLLFVDSPDGPVNYEAMFETADRANVELVKVIEQDVIKIKDLEGDNATLAERNAELENDKTATNREIAKLKREVEELRVAGAEPNDL